jgi:hypothetical protein
MVRETTTIAPSQLIPGYYHPRKAGFSFHAKLSRSWREWFTGLWAIAEPSIWQTIDDAGNIWWHAYNPVTGNSAMRESATEILAWLDSASH